MNKTKRIILIVAILAVAIFLLFIGIYYFQRKSPESQALKYISEMQKKYKEDTYGGDTPEQTLQMFIDALKKGNIDLASKYFVIEKQNQWKNDLEKIKNNGRLQNMISDLERNKEKKALSENYITFYIYNDKNLLAVAIDIIKIPNGKWKISSM